MLVELARVGSESRIRTDDQLVTHYPDVSIGGGLYHLQSFLKKDYGVRRFPIRLWRKGTPRSGIVSEPSNT